VIVNELGMSEKSMCRRDAARSRRLARHGVVRSPGPTLRMIGAAKSGGRPSRWQLSIGEAGAVSHVSLMTVEASA